MPRRALQPAEDGIEEVRKEVFLRLGRVMMRSRSGLMWGVRLLDLVVMSHGVIEFGDMARSRM
jgi:hypothetical protein